jgi:perosamine synthetase
MIVTDDPLLADRCRSLRNLCFKPEQRFIHDEMGWNFRMTNLQAAVGCAQLERINEFITMKKQIGRTYNLLLNATSQIQLPIASTDYAENIYWVYPVLIKDKITITAKELMNKLQQKKVGTRPFFWPIHLQPVFSKKGMFKGESYPVSEMIAKKGFYLPSGMAIKEEQIVAVAQRLNKILQEI